MLSVLQSVFIIILKPISKVSSKLNARVRSVCIQLTCLLFPLYFIWYYTGLQHRELIPDFLGNHTAKQLMGCIFILLLIVFSLDREPKKVKWSVWIMYPMIICGIWMMVISFIHPVGSGYRAFAMMLIFAFPCLYFVWNNRDDYEKLFDLLARAICVTGVLFFLFSFYLASKGMLAIDYNSRCTGLMENANMFSMVGMVSTCGALYLLARDRASWVRFFLYSIAFGMGIAIVLMGQSRISLLVCVCNVLVTVFFYYRYCSNSRAFTIIVRFICVAGIVVGMVCLSYICIDLQENVKAQINGQTGSSQETTADPAATQSSSPSVIDRITYDENTTLNTYTAGRYHIWKGYAKFLNLMGNDFSKADWTALTQNTVVHAHNNFFEMAYRFGIPLGVLFILFEAIVCLKAVQYLFVNRQKKMALLLPILFVVMFLFESMFDIATLPFERDAPFYFYLALIPMVDMNYKFKDAEQHNRN